MKYFWHDHRAQPTKLEPRNELFLELVTIFQAEYVSSATNLPSDSPFVCFVHPSGNGNETSQCAWENKANSGKEQFVALLSIEGDPNPARKEAEGVVGLPRNRLLLVVENLKKDPSLKTKFEQEISLGTFGWNLLAPGCNAEYLIAFYLIKLAKVEVANITLISKQAFVEYKELAKRFGEDYRPQDMDDLGSDASLAVIASLLSKWHCS